MNQKQFDRLLRKLLNAAAARGVRTPVLALPLTHSGPGAAAYAAAEGRLPRPQRLGDGAAAWTPRAAARHLRARGGVGGAAAANALESPPAGTQYWNLILTPENLTVIASGEGETLLQGCTRYDGLNTLP